MADTAVSEKTDRASAARIVEAALRVFGVAKRGDRDALRRELRGLALTLAPMLHELGDRELAGAMQAALWASAGFQPD